MTSRRFYLISSTITSESKWYSKLSGVVLLFETIDFTDYMLVADHSFNVHAFKKNNLKDAILREDPPFLRDPNLDAMLIPDKYLIPVKKEELPFAIQGDNEQFSSELSRINPLTGYDPDFDSYLHIENSFDEEEEDGYWENFLANEGLPF